LTCIIIIIINRIKKKKAEQFFKLDRVCQQEIEYWHANFSLWKLSVEVTSQHFLSENGCCNNSKGSNMSSNIYAKVAVH